MINNYDLSTALKLWSTLSCRRSEQTIVADGVFAAMEMDERLLFRRRRRHMLIVLSSKMERRREREEGLSLSLSTAPRFVFRRNETNIQMVFVQNPSAPRGKEEK